GSATQFGEAVGRVEPIDGGRGFAASDDLGDGGIEAGGGGVGFDELADGGVAFGSPGAFVEEAGGVEERGEIDLDEVGTGGAQAVEGGGEEGGRLGVAE